MKIDDAFEKAALASLPIMTPSGSLDLMMRWMAADGSDISSGTGLTTSGSAPFSAVATAGLAMAVSRSAQGRATRKARRPSLP